MYEISDRRRNARDRQPSDRDRRINVKALDYLELIALTKDRVRGQIVLDSIYKLEPDTEWYEKQSQKIAKYDRKIIELTRERGK